MTSNILRDLAEPPLLPSPYQNLCPRIGSQHFIHDERWRSTLPGTKLEVKFQEQFRQKQLQHHRCQKSARTRVPTSSKIQIGCVQGGELVFVALANVLTHFIISKAVKNVRIRRHLRIKQYTSTRHTHMCAGGYFQPGGKGQRSQRNTIEGH